jgi:hypothetical protein
MGWVKTEWVAVSHATKRGAVVLNRILFRFLVCDEFSDNLPGTG